jgi:hypothetical protein
MVTSEDKCIAPNLYQRNFSNGTIKYRIRLRPNRKSFSITFDTEKDARKWLQKNYYGCMQFPDHYRQLKKRTWL